MGSWIQSQTSTLVTLWCMEGQGTLWCPSCLSSSSWLLNSGRQLNQSPFPSSEYRTSFLSVSWSRKHTPKSLHLAKKASTRFPVFYEVISGFGRKTVNQSQCSYNSKITEIWKGLSHNFNCVKSALQFSRIKDTIAYMSPADGKEETDLNCLSCPWLFGTIKEERPWPLIVISIHRILVLQRECLRHLHSWCLNKLNQWYGYFVFITLETTIAFPWLKACMSADHHYFLLLFRRKASRGGELFNIWMIEKLFREYYFRCNLRNTTSFWSQQEKCSHSLLSQK